MDAQYVEMFSEALSECGAMAVSIEECQEKMEHPIFDESPTRQFWEHCKISALLSEKIEVNHILEKATALADLPTIPYFKLQYIEEQDWVKQTQAQFEPIQISNRLWIVPTWHIPKEGVINIRLDPGTAFGTGSHPTTQLCLKWLDRHLPMGSTVLDYGCGSGILAIAAMQLGARQAFGIDIDPRAIQTATANAQQNGVEVHFSLPHAPLSAVDIVLANILANPLELLAPLLAQSTLIGGKIILSGILTSQAESLIACYSAWFQMEIFEKEGDWVCLVGNKKQ